MRDAVSIAVVIPCMNERAHIGALLHAIADQDVKPDEVIIVDGGSSDGTLDEINQVSGDLPAIKVETVVAPELALPAVINHAVRRSSSNIIVRLDAHSAPGSDYIRRAVEHLTNPMVGVVGGPWRIVPGAATAKAAAIARAVGHSLGAGDASYRLPRLKPGPSKRSNLPGTSTSNLPGPSDVDTVPFGCFRRDTWELVGGLNEQLLGNEDYEFNYRVRQRGLAVRLDPAMQCRYVARATIAALARQYFRYGWCKVQMLRMHPSSLRWRQAVPTIFVAVVVVLSSLSIMLPAARMALLALLGVYLLVLIGVTLAIALREGAWQRALWMPIVFATIHMTWGSGALVHLLAVGRWPRREFLFGIPPSTMPGPRPPR